MHFLEMLLQCCSMIPYVEMSLVTFKELTTPSPQVGIIITLVWAPKVQLVPVGFPNTLVRNSGTCFQGSKVDETLAWLEQRARHVKEEIALAEIQLQTLHQDLSFLQVHSAQFQKYLLELSSDSQSAHSQCL
jgi:hypothetical protein